MQSKTSFVSVAAFSVGFALGGVMMFIMDPVAGGRRRSLARDKAVKVKNELLTYSSKKARHLRNRGKGLVAKSGAPDLLH